MRYTRRLNLLCAAIAGATLAAGSAASAQSMPSDHDRTPRSETQGQAPPPASPNPSEQLDRSKGVITPPSSVDPGMPVAPPPGSSKSRVIPPPGSPGGDQSVEPK